MRLVAWTTVAMLSRTRGFVARRPLVMRSAWGIPNEKRERSEVEQRDVVSSPGRSASPSRNPRRQQQDWRRWRKEGSRRSRQPRHWDEFPSTREFVYGVAPVDAALQYRRRELYALYYEGEKPDDCTLRLCDEAGIEAVEQPKGSLQEALGQGKAVHQNVALCCSPLEFTRLDAAFDAPLWLALDEIQDPRNLGAIVRSARFFDCPVVSCAKNSAPPSPVASKASAGALEEIELYDARNLVNFLTNSKPHFKVVGAAIDAGPKRKRSVATLRNFRLEQPTIVVLGNEGTGLRTNIIDVCDDLLKVQGRLAPDESGVDSLNVAVTAALLLHHLDLQIERLEPSSTSSP